MTNPMQVHEPGFGPDYRINDDSAGFPNRLWRMLTPPAGEDGTIPDIRHTMDEMTYPSVAADGSVVPFPHPQVRTSTFDIPNNEMG